MINVYKGIRDHYGVCTVKVNGKPLMPAAPENPKRVPTFDWHKDDPAAARQLAYSILANELGRSVAEGSWGHFRMFVLDNLSDWVFVLPSEDIRKWMQDHLLFIEEYGKWTDSQEECSNVHAA